MKKSVPSPAPSPESRHIGRPNPQALNALLDRYLIWLGRQEQEKRAKKARGRNRRASIKI